MSTTKLTPLFEERAKVTIAKCTEVFDQRGAKYGDTWRNCQWLISKAVARKLGAAIPEDAFTALGAAFFADMKYQRFEGGYDSDHPQDGINYQAVMDAEVDEVLKSREAVKPPLPTPMPNFDNLAYYPYTCLLCQGNGFRRDEVNFENNECYCKACWERRRVSPFA